MSDTIRSKLKGKGTTFEVMDALQQMFRQQSEQAHHEVIKKYMKTKMRSGTRVRDPVMMTMANYFNEVELHGSALDKLT